MHGVVTVAHFAVFALEALGARLAGRYRF